jgi:hypothetical protein
MTSPQASDASLALAPDAHAGYSAAVLNGSTYRVSLREDEPEGIASGAWARCAVCSKYRSLGPDDPPIEKGRDAAWSCHLLRDNLPGMNPCDAPEDVLGEVTRRGRGAGWEGAAGEGEGEVEEGGEGEGGGEGGEGGGAVVHVQLEGAASRAFLGLGEEKRAEIAQQLSVAAAGLLFATQAEP